MPSFQDSAVIFFLALLLFGPKKLPELARQLGKLMGEFRRASSEFRLQMEDELRASEQQERRKQIAAIESAAPKPAATLPETSAASVPDGTSMGVAAAVPPGENTIAPPALAGSDLATSAATSEFTLDPHPHEQFHAAAPVPIATSGDLSMMPPASGLPVARNGNGAYPPVTHDTGSAASSDLAPAFAAIPHAAPSGAPADEPPPPPDRYYRAAPPAADHDAPPLTSAAEPAAAQHG